MKSGKFGVMLTVLSLFLVAILTACGTEAPTPTPAKLIWRNGEFTANVGLKYW
jgi:hypothetical protein